ncbi:MAG: TolC family protein [Woeseiaceae bacterium]
MNIIIYKTIISIALVSSFSFSLLASENDLNIYQVIQRVINNHSSLKISFLEAEQAELQIYTIKSQLGWMLNSSIGLTHDLTGFGTPSDRFDVSSGVSRQLESGGTLSLTGGYRYEDSSLSFEPLPNPAHTTRIDLSYRLPLLQGNNNPIYIQGLISSQATQQLAKNKWLLARLSVTEKVKDLFYAMAFTQAQINNIKKSIKRGRRTQAYILNNAKLGLSEEKDKLQVQAQLDSSLANLRSRQFQWQQQQNSLNRLILNESNQRITPILLKFENKFSVNKLITNTTQTHPAYAIAKINIDIASSNMLLARDIKEDKLDLIMSAGSRTSDGKNKTSTVSEQDWAGKVSLEYTHLFDDRGIDSKLSQAKLSKNIAEVDKQRVKNDINYTVRGLVSEIKAAKLSVMASKNELKSELLKLQEAEYRFKRGRVDTAQLIRFQNEYSLAELSHINMKIKLNNRVVSLQLFTGELWEKLSLYPDSSVKQEEQL